VSLTSVMRLMIEKMRENISASLPLRCAVERSVVQQILESCDSKPLNEAIDAFVFPLPSGGQRRQVIEDYSVEPCRMIPHAGQAPHPNSVACQQMVKSSVHALEICADISSIVAMTTTHAASNISQVKHCILIDHQAKTRR
jgi:hypothetical protein